MVIEVNLPTLGSEQRDHDQIEGAIATLRHLFPGIETVDAEIGEWAILRYKEGRYEITVTVVRRLPGMWCEQS